jgi:hypothetical protein
MKFNYNKISCKNVLSLSVLVINSLNYAIIQNESQKLENKKIDYHRYTTSARWQRNRNLERCQSEDYFAHFVLPTHCWNPGFLNNLDCRWERKEKRRRKGKKLFSIVCMTYSSIVHSPLHPPVTHVEKLDGYLYFFTNYADLCV